MKSRTPWRASRACCRTQDITSSEESPEFDGVTAMRGMTDVWFFGFDLRLEGYAKRTGRTIGPDTLEPVVLEIYEYAKRMKPVQFLNAMAVMNTERRRLGRYFAKYDVWLSPTTPKVAEPWGTYNLGAHRRDDGQPGGEGVPRHVLVRAAAQHRGNARHFPAAGDALDRPADWHPARFPAGDRASDPAARDPAGSGSAVERPDTRSQHLCKQHITLML